MQNFLFVKNGHRYSKICFQSILYVEAMNRYVQVVTTNKIYTIMSSLSNVAELLPADIFFRIHRSFIVSLEHTTGFDNQMLYMPGKEFPIGRQYKGKLQEKVKILCGDVKDEKIKMDILKNAG